MPYSDKMETKMNTDKKTGSPRMECEICGYIYDPEKGLARDQVSPGTPFDELDENWVCPDCQVGKEHFVEMA
jgi:rubredoxin